MNPGEISIGDFGYQLPDEKIAKHPLSNREESKLLVFRNGKITDSGFTHLCSFLPKNSLLVFNNTKVIHARILFRKPSGAQIEVFCLEPTSNNYVETLGSNRSCTWYCLIGNSKRWKGETLLKEISIHGVLVNFEANIISKNEAEFTVEFSWNNPNISFGEILSVAGDLPIPPYLNRKPQSNDEIAYQTVYAKEEGSVAAPTAGLHFTPKILNELLLQNIQKTELTLHVGAGTFKPVKTAKMKDHDMHRESIFIRLISIQMLLDQLINNQFIIPVGTTSLRTIESIYWFGVKMIEQLNTPLTNSEMKFEINQWEPYQLNQNIDPKDSLSAVINYMKQNNLEFISGNTQILIVPGYSFKLAKAIITNFHQPNSTLLLLIAALIGNDWKKIYDHALSNEYRFLSFGDSSLLFSHSLQ